MTCGKAIRKDQPFDEDGAGLEESIVGDWEPIISKRFYDLPSPRAHTDCKLKKIRT